MSVDTTNLLEIPDDGDVTASLAGHGWGDGLPVVAPTPERVTEMLSGCGGADPDEVVAVLAYGLRRYPSLMPCSSKHGWNRCHRMFFTTSASYRFG